MSKRHDLTGKTFGRLTVLERHGIIYGDRIAWRCRCDCGGEAITSTSKLLTGAKRSCGCLERENNASLTRHGMYGTRTYRVWQNMKTRCLNPKSKFYGLYGGRGITVCQEWMTFEGFLKDMGECPPKMTIDRLDNDLGYFKGNCEWRSMKEQANNRSSNISISLNGETRTLKEWAERFDMKYTTAYWRHKNGWPPERLFSR